jgi:GxxExxY protein
MNHQDTKAPSVEVQKTSISLELNDVGRLVVDAAFHVHKTFGPGLLESIYEECFCIALANRNVRFKRQYTTPLVFEGVELANPCRIDLLVEDAIVVELKCVERLLPVHQAQILTYMKLVPARLGYLINFNVPLIRDGIKRVAL